MKLATHMLQKSCFGGWWCRVSCRVYNCPIAAPIMSNTCATPELGMTLEHIPSWPNPKGPKIEKNQDLSGPFSDSSGVPGPEGPGDPVRGGAVPNSKVNFSGGPLLPGKNRTKKIDPRIRVHNSGIQNKKGPKIEKKFNLD